MNNMVANTQKMMGGGKSPFLIVILGGTTILLAIRVIAFRKAVA